MTSADIQHLIALCPAARASAHLDVGTVFRTAHAPAASANSLLNQPDALWRLARKLAAQTRGTITTPDDTAFRWVAAAVSVLNGGAPSADADTVGAAIRVAEDGHLRPIIEAALVAPDASTANVAEGLGLEPEVVECFADLFFNVPDRRDDRSYVHRLVYAGRDEDGETDSASLRVIAHRTDLATLLIHVGYKPPTRDDRDAKSLAREVFAQTMAAARIELAAGCLSQRRPTPALAHALRMLNGMTLRDLEDQGVGSTSLLSQAIADTLAADVILIKGDYKGLAEEAERNDRAGQFPAGEEGE